MNCYVTPSVGISLRMGYIDPIHRFSGLRIGGKVITLTIFKVRNEGYLLLNTIRKNDSEDGRPVFSFIDWMGVLMKENWAPYSYECL